MPRCGTGTASYAFSSDSVVPLVKSIKCMLFAGSLLSIFWFSLSLWLTQVAYADAATINSAGKLRYLTQQVGVGILAEAQGVQRPDWADVTFSTIDSIIAGLLGEASGPGIPEMLDDAAKDMLAPWRGHLAYFRDTGLRVKSEQVSAAELAEFVDRINRATTEVDNIVHAASDDAQDRLTRLFILNIVRAVSGCLWAGMTAWTFVRAWAPYASIYNELQDRRLEIQSMETEAASSVPPLDDAFAAPGGGCSNRARSHGRQGLPRLHGAAMNASALFARGRIMACAPAPLSGGGDDSFNGFWRLMGSARGTAKWLHSLQIRGDWVVLGNGNTASLDRGETGLTTLFRRTLTLEGEGLTLRDRQGLVHRFTRVEGLSSMVVGKRSSGNISRTCNSNPRDAGDGIGRGESWPYEAEWASSASSSAVIAKGPEITVVPGECQP